MKLWSLRSTRWALALGVLALLLGGLINDAFNMSRWASLPMHVRQHYDAIDASLIGYQFAQLAIGVLGVVVVTGEYATGMIRSTFMAVPARLPVLWAKVFVFAAIVLVLAIPATLIDFLASAAIFTQHHISLSLSSPHAVRAVLGIAAYLAVLAMFTVSLGALLRNTAAGIAAFAGILFALPGFVGVLSTNIKDTIAPYLPSNAASAFFTAVPDPAEHLLHPWVGLAVFVGYAVVLLLASTILLARRDV